MEPMLTSTWEAAKNCLQRWSIVDMGNKLIMKIIGKNYFTIDIKVHIIISVRHVYSLSLQI
jgi:hypothetical protein